MYLAVTYLLAKLVEELVINSIASLGVSAMLFYAVRLQGSFGLIYVTYLVTVSVGIGIGYFVSSWAPTMDAANAIVPIYGVTMLFFAGGF